MFYRFIQSYLYRLDPEVAHNMAIYAMQKNWDWFFWQSRYFHQGYPYLQQNLNGLNWHHPIGFSAGFDKQANVFFPLIRQGFAGVEVGTVTEFPQSGNEKPRLFRFQSDSAIVNRMGFNSVGWEVFLRNYQKQMRYRSFYRLPQPLLTHYPVGINIGVNKNAPDFLAAFQSIYAKAIHHGSYTTVNISSPNTQGLRQLAEAEQTIIDLLSALTQLKRDALVAKPLYLKLSPDMTEAQTESMLNILETCRFQGINGIILTNTTVNKPEHIQEVGGYSGPLLLEKSTAFVKKARAKLGDSFTIIGVGGIQSGADLFQMLSAGANITQLYTAYIYQGPQLVKRYLDELSALMQSNTIVTIKDFKRYWA